MYTQSLRGKWLNSGDVKNNTRVTIVSEVRTIPSQFKTERGMQKTQEAGHIMIDGRNEHFLFRFNSTTIDGLVDAYGGNPKSWIGKSLTLKKTKGLVDRVMRVSMFLVPDGYKLGTDAAGFVHIASDETGFDETAVPADANTIDDDAETLGTDDEDVEVL